jgi:hypothetical protein
MCRRNRDIMRPHIITDTPIMGTGKNHEAERIEIIGGVQWSQFIINAEKPPACFFVAVTGAYMIERISQRGFVDDAWMGIDGMTIHRQLAALSQQAALAGEDRFELMVKPFIKPALCGIQKCLMPFRNPAKVQSQVQKFKR